MAPTTLAISTTADRFGETTELFVAVNLTLALVCPFGIRMTLTGSSLDAVNAYPLSGFAVSEAHSFPGASSPLASRENDRSRMLADIDNRIAILIDKESFVGNNHFQFMAVRRNLLLNDSRDDRPFVFDKSHRIIATVGRIVIFVDPLRVVVIGSRYELAGNPV